MDKVFDKIHEYENQVLKGVFPKARLKSSTVWGSEDKAPNSFDGLISAGGLFEDTPYQYFGDNLFLHFTTFPVLSIIMNSGFIRMSDFNCLDDINEMMFASKAMWGESEVDYLHEEKGKMFSLSACESNNNTIQNKHMWDNYAGKGQGCAIEYEFSSLGIHNFNIGKIQYGKSNLKPLKEINKLSIKFAEKNGGFRVNDFPNFLIRISSFHKDIKYKKEQEVRLLYYRDGGLGSHKPHLNEYRDFYKDHQVRNFIKIYLKGKNKYLPNDKLPEEEVINQSPQIEIKRVIIGPNVVDVLDTLDQLGSMRKEFHQSFEIWRWNGLKEAFKIK